LPHVGGAWAPHHRGQKEKAMNKSLIAIASATVALATFASSSAEAGFGIHFGFGGGGFHGFHHHWHPEYIVRTPVQPRVYVARKAKPVSVAKEDPVTVAAVHNENSSIAVASADIAVDQTTDSVEKIIVKKDKTAQVSQKPATVAEATVDSETQTGKRLDCKKFFPSVGLTLTVPCE
jgi:hypothetical protein